MTTTIRAVIMLVVLVGGPVAWMYYGPLPDGAQRVVNRFIAAAKEAVDWDKHFGAGAPPTKAKPQQAAAATASARPAAGTKPSVTPTVNVAAGQQTLAQQVEPLLSQLQKLGVAEYALEPWGADRTMFRFHCEMPVAGGRQSTEQFEAIAADPRASIERVVSDVSTWQAERVAMAGR